MHSQAVSVDVASTELDNCFINKQYKIKWTSLGHRSKPPLICVHGTPWSSRLWAPTAASLSAYFHCFLYDLPGYGESQEFTGDVTEKDKIVGFAAQGDILAELIKHWKEEGHILRSDPPPIVLAHDIGGIIALRAAGLRGCEYRALCLVDVVATRPTGSPFYRLIMENSSIFNQVPPAIFEGMLRSYVRGAAHKPLSSAHEAMLVNPWLLRGKEGQEAFVRQVAQASEPAIEEAEHTYGHIGKQMPIRIIWGTDDYWIPYERAAKLGKMLGTDDIVTVQQAGHLIMLDQPDVLAYSISAWLAKVAPGCFESLPALGQRHGIDIC